MKQEAKNRKRLILTALVWIAAVVLTWIALRFPANWDLVALALFLVLAWVAEADRVRIPQLGVGLSLAFSVFLAALLVFGPLPAALVTACAVMVVNLGKGYPVVTFLYNLAQVYVSALVTGAVLVGLGWLPLETSSLASVGLTLGVAVVCSFLLNTLLVDAFLATRSPSFWAGFLSIARIDIHWSLLSHAITGALGVLMYYVYFTPLGLAGIVLLLGSLVAVRVTVSQNAELREAHLETMRILSEVLDARDPYTHGHSARVASWAKDIAGALGLPEPEQEVIQSAALLHDIGKVAIQDDILFKTGALTDEEFARMREHPERGAQMIRPIGFLRTVQEIVRHHHERYDGRGYPQGISGKAIPLGARIIAVADAWDAMTLERAYRPALSLDQAAEQLLQGRGTQFDPNIVDVFLNKVLPARGVELALEGEPVVRQGAPAMEREGSS